MEEWFDVVNRQDEAVACARRAYVHAHGLRHRSVHLLVFDETAQRVYLQLRSAEKDTHPLVWDTSCCGHVDRGEDYETALWRELREELGLAREDLQCVAFCFKLEACAVTGWEFVHVYQSSTVQEPRPDPAEIQEGRWVEREVVDSWVATQPADFAPSFRYLWPRVSGL
ncbi:MAG: NUDIX domain-containing protein [Verrucomicrobiota bacterium]